jgi:hypothetical protein
MHRTSLKKLIYKPRTDTPRVKWLERLKLEEEFKTPT